MASKNTLYRRMAAEIDEERAEAPRVPHPTEGRPQDENLQAMIKREFLAEYDRGPILTPRLDSRFANDFAQYLAFKYPAALAHLFSAPTPAAQKLRGRLLPASDADATEIESEAPT